MTKEQRAELRRLAEAATPGPWLNEEAAVEIEMGGGVRCTIAGCGAGRIHGAETSDNAAYIAAANPQAMLALLGEVDRLNELVGHLDKEIADLNEALRIEAETNGWSKNEYRILADELQAKLDALKRDGTDEHP